MSIAASARRARGFTLLELLIALSIFGLLAVMSYSGLASVMDLRMRTEDESSRLAQLQKAYLVMQRDIEQVIARPVRDQYGDALAPLLGEENLELTRGGWSNPLGQARSTLQRVTWSYEDRELLRYAWWVLDRAQDSQPARELVLDGVESMQVRYLAGKDTWLEQWPAPFQGSAVDTEAEMPAILPVAVEISIEHEHYGELVWLFRVPR